MSSASDDNEPEEPPIRFTNNRKIDREQQAGKPDEAADGGDHPAARGRGRAGRCRPDHR